MRLLATRPRTISEMRECLGRHFEVEAVDRTVSRLIQDGLLDDADFSHQWRQSRERRKPRGRNMIERELKQRGVAEDLIETALEGYDSLDAAYRAASRYAARQVSKDHTAFNRRVSAFLQRRGFETAVVRKTLLKLRDKLGIGTSAAQECG